MAFFRDLRNQFLEFMSQQTVLTRLMAGIVMLALLTAGIYQAFHYGRTINYELLYAGLDAQMAATVRQELQRQGIEPQIEESPQGWAIRVPEGKALAMRLDLAPTLESAEGNKGWKLFDDKDFTTTFYALQVKKQRAIMGELARTIRRMDHVKNVAVNVSIPEKSPFIADEKPPTASVMLTLEQGAEFGQAQVRTIQAFVAGSIEGLKPEGVVVTDTAGRELSRRNGTGKVGEGSDESERVIEVRKNHARDFEKYLETKILAQLGPIFGANHVTASVNVEFDYTTKRETETKYDPKGIPVSEMQKTVTGSSPGRIAEGIVGATRQVTNAAAATSATAAAGSQEQSTEKISNMMVGKKETETVFPEYQIKRVATAVFVDSPATFARDPKTNAMTESRFIVDKKDGKVTPNTIDDKTLKKIEEQVKAIVGYSQERPGGTEDVVSVTNMAFGTPPVASMEEVQPMQWMDWLKMLRAPLFWFVAVTLLLFTVVRPLMRIVAPPPAQLADRRALLVGGSAGQHAALAGGEGATGGELTYDGLQRGTLSGPPLAADAIEAQQQQLDDSILEASRANPKKVPLVLRAWMES